ncbi:MAG: hypothetical protein PHV30_02340 [Candidatus Margulisbacteria bacterium]|nr:hypothetical protein [Candidatus Margulisiibacteriota bacterium]
MKKVAVSIIGAAILIFILGGCAQRLGLVNNSSPADSIARFDISGAQSLFIANAVNKSVSTGMSAKAAKVASSNNGNSDNSGNNGNGNGNNGNGNGNSGTPATVTPEPVVTPVTTVTPVPEDITTEVSGTKSLYKLMPDGTVQPVGFYDPYNNLIQFQAEVVGIKNINKDYLSVKFLDSATSGSFLYFLVNKTTGIAYLYGTNINENTSITYPSDGTKYYFINNQGRLVRLDFTVSSTTGIKMTVLPALKGVNYATAKIDKNENIIVGDKFIKQTTGGYEYLTVASQGKDVYVSKSGDFNYYSGAQLFKLCLDANNAVQSIAITTTQGTDYQFVATIESNTPLLTNTDYGYYSFPKLSSSGVAQSLLIAKYNANTMAINTIEYPKTAKAVAGNQLLYVLKDNKTIEKVDTNLTIQSFYTTNEYDITSVAANNANEVYFYGLRYSDGAYIAAVLNPDGTQKTITTSVTVAEVSYLTPLKTK